MSLEKYKMAKEWEFVLMSAMTEPTKAKAGSYYSGTDREMFNGEWTLQRPHGAAGKENQHTAIGCPCIHMAGPWLRSIIFPIQERLQCTPAPTSDSLDWGGISWVSLASSPVGGDDRGSGNYFTLWSKIILPLSFPTKAPGFTYWSRAIAEVCLHSRKSRQLCHCQKSSDAGTG